MKLLVIAQRNESGFSVHACAFLGASLIDCYSGCGNAECARQVPDATECKDMVSWTRMVACYEENECFEESLKLFCR